jgi:serine/threonine-protein kinase
VGPIGQLTVNSAGSLLFSEFTYNRLSAFDQSTRALSVIAGNVQLRSSGDGGPATKAGIAVSYCFAFDSKENMFVCDSSHYIRRVSAETGTISTVAGNGGRSYSGDRLPALSAAFGTLLSLAVDPSDNVYFADDASNRIRRIDATTGVVETIAGKGPTLTGSFNNLEFCCERELATKSQIPSPRSLTFDRNGDLLFESAGRIFRITKTGELRTIVGTGQEGFSGDGGPATKARIGATGIVVDKFGNLFIAEFENNRIRRVDGRSGVITTVGGNGLPRRPRQPFM